ncbi:MAG: MBL fold metallo-hydrolase [Candidatus Omnitrophota bacterium]
MSVILKQMKIGPMLNFVYFIGSEKTGEIAVVDPAWDIDYLLKEAALNSFSITRILLTHGHPDHTDGADELARRFNVPVTISIEEAPFYTPDCRNLEAVRPGSFIEIGDVRIECIGTPGHSPGGMCFKCEDILLTGDTLFINGCGRCDLPGGDAKNLYHSLYDVILKLPDSTIIYPGHHYGTLNFSTLEEQRKSNPYLKCRSEQEFLRNRMGY